MRFHIQSGARVREAMPTKSHRRPITRETACEICLPPPDDAIRRPKSNTLSQQSHKPRELSSPPHRSDLVRGNPNSKSCRWNRCKTSQPYTEPDNRLE